VERPAPGASPAPRWPLPAVEVPPSARHLGGSASPGASPAPGTADHHPGTPSSQQARPGGHHYMLLSAELTAPLHLVVCPRTVRPPPARRHHRARHRGPPPWQVLEAWSGAWDTCPRRGHPCGHRGGHHRGHPGVPLPTALGVTALPGIHGLLPSGAPVATARPDGYHSRASMVYCHRTATGGRRHREAAPGPPSKTWEPLGHNPPVTMAYPRLPRYQRSGGGRRAPPPF